MESQIAIGTLVRHFPNLRLQGRPEDLVWRTGMIIRGLSHLPVTF